MIRHRLEKQRFTHSNRLQQQQKQQNQRFTHSHSHSLEDQRLIRHRLEKQRFTHSQGSQNLQQKKKNEPLMICWTQRLSVLGVPLKVVAHVASSLSINHCHCLPAKLPVKLCKQYQHQHQHCLQNRLRPWAPSISSCISARGRRKNPKMSPSLQRHQKQKQCLLRLFQARLRLRLRLRAQTTAPQPRQQHSPSNHPGSGSPRLDPAATG